VWNTIKEYSLCLRCLLMASVHLVLGFAVTCCLPQSTSFLVIGKFRGALDLPTELPATAECQHEA
jgi:hypothetical protein